MSTLGTVRWSERTSPTSPCPRQGPFVLTIAIEIVAHNTPMGQVYFTEGESCATIVIKQVCTEPCTTKNIPQLMSINICKVLWRIAAWEDTACSLYQSMESTGAYKTLIMRSKNFVNPGNNRIETMATKTQCFHHRITQDIQANSMSLPWHSYVLTWKPGLTSKSMWYMHDIVWCQMFWQPWSMQCFIKCKSNCIASPEYVSGVDTHSNGATAILPWPVGAFKPSWMHLLGRHCCQ